VAFSLLYSTKRPSVTYPQCEGDWPSKGLLRSGRVETLMAALPVEAPAWVRVRRRSRRRPRLRAHPRGAVWQGDRSMPGRRWRARGGRQLLPVQNDALLAHARDLVVAGMVVAAAVGVMIAVAWDVRRGEGGVCASGHLDHPGSLLSSVDGLPAGVLRPLAVVVVARAVVGAAGGDCGCV
jgi:hypothetical protein